MSKELEQEIEEILAPTPDADVTPVVASGEPTVSDPPSAEVADATSGTVPDNGEPPAVSIPAVEPPPTESTEPTEVESLKAQIASLTSLVDSLSGKGGETGPTVEPQKIEIPDVTTVLSDIDFDDIMENKESFIKFMSSVVTAVKETTKQEMLTSIPQVVGTFVQRQASMRDVAKLFYEQHPELGSVKRYVTTVANEVSANNPTWNIGQVLEEAAKLVKDRLNIKAVVEAKEVKNTTRPALPGGSRGARVLSPNVSGLQKEIDDILTD